MYTATWFDQNIPNWRNWLGKYKGKADLKFLEIGCFEGRATLWLLEQIMTGSNPSMSVIDTFAGSPENTPEQNESIEKNFRENLKGWEPILNVYKGESGVILREEEMTPECFDLIYIDGSHEAWNVLEDILLSWRLLKKGGVMIFDDYGWKKFPELIRQPRLAIDAFLTIFAGQYSILGKGYQVAVVKI